MWLGLSAASESCNMSLMFSSRSSSASSISRCVLKVRQIQNSIQKNIHITIVFILLQAQRFVLQWVRGN
jgi:hypothetical protein